MKERHIDIMPVAQAPVRYLVWHEDEERIVGYCLITANIRRGDHVDGLINLSGGDLKTATDSKEALIWHIYVDKDYRRQGYARTLIEALKVHYDSIYSEALTPDSKKLMMATGFVVDDSTGGDAVKIFRWTKK